LAEILLPMLIMLIMVGLRAAVTKDTTDLDLHYKDPVQLDTAGLKFAASHGIPIVNGTAFDNMAGPIAWDTKNLTQFWYNGDPKHDRGVVKVHSIQFVPNTAPEVIAMAADFKKAYPDLASNVDTRFASDDELHEYVRGSTYATSKENAAIAMAIVLNKVGNTWNYVIRGNTTQGGASATTLATEESTVNTLQTVYQEDKFPVLMVWGHHLMQDFVEKWIVEQTTGIKLDRSYSFQPFPTPPYIFDNFASVISGVLGLFFTIIYMWPVTRLVKGIVEEKQLRIKEGMRMMGLPDSALYCSWFGTYCIIFAITSLLITLVTAASVYEKSNKVYIFLFFFLFSLSTFSFCWFTSVFFSRSQVATTFSALIFLGFFFPYFAVSSSSTSASAKAVACLSSPICFGLGATVLAKLESEGTGVNVDTANLMVDNFSYNATIVSDEHE
jgi:hypothetical protein